MLPDDKGYVVSITLCLKSGCQIEGGTLSSNYWVIVTVPRR